MPLPCMPNQSAFAVLRGNKPVPNLKYATELGVCKGHYRLLVNLGPAIEQNTCDSRSGLVANLRSTLSCDIERHSVLHNVTKSMTLLP